MAKRQLYTIVFADDIDEQQRTVQVLAVGEKRGNRLIVSGEIVSGEEDVEL